MTNKQTQYAIKISSQIVEMFDEECDNHIDKHELSEGDNATDFFHAITIASAELYARLTGENIDLLAYNHIANRLIMQNRTES